ncbi:MAG: DUF115 domain-containing protein [Treponema sp.]|jgi:hypothetical protein|nr:DUF115 domain-containing protein [Treponema sp.]
MDERIFPAKNGYTLYAGETALHSRYDPALEAEKYIASLEISGNCRYFVLIEPGLAYLAGALRKQFPRSVIIGLHCSPFYGKLPPGLPFPDVSWNPSMEEDLEDFLETRIPGAEASSVRLIEWRPSINAYGRACVELAERTVECIRRITANKVTLRNFGRRWLRNGLRNLGILRNHVRPRRGTGPVLICAAGPGLEDSLEEIRLWKQSPLPPLIIAAASSVPALLGGGIEPGLIISTDGGNWALFHLAESCRAGNSPAAAVLLSAAIPSQMETWPLLTLCDGSLWQELLLRSCRVPFLVFPQRGTVSAAALDLALFLTSGEIYIAGLDLAHRDLKTHARPYAFERIMEAAVSRYRPFYSRAFERENQIRSGGSHGIYAAWFRTSLKTGPSRIYTLGSSPEQTGIPRGTPRILNVPPADPAAQPGFSSPTGGKPQTGGAGKKEGIAILLEALSNPLTEKQLAEELGELIFPGAEESHTCMTGKIKEELLKLF